jgi:putative membrane protein
MLGSLLVAHAWHHGHWWLLWPLLWLAVIATVLVVWRRRRGTPPGTSAQTILGERFARGEIDVEEYRERLGQLQS